MGSEAAQEIYLKWFTIPPLCSIKPLRVYFHSRLFVVCALDIVLTPTSPPLTNYLTSSSDTQFPSPSTSTKSLTTTAFSPSTVQAVSFTTTEFSPSSLQAAPLNSLRLLFKQYHSLPLNSLHQLFKHHPLPQNPLQFHRCSSNLPQFHQISPSLHWLFWNPQCFYQFKVKFLQ